MRLWLPAVNNDGRWGRWQAVEILEPTDMKDAFGSDGWTDSAKAEDLLNFVAEGLDAAAVNARQPTSGTAA
ncbi:MAG: hypothetical protein IPO30_20495 [Hyphomonadaceae bacterium]|nr:hypothetical protein [Hyphomonadaceae bacterium]